MAFCPSCGKQTKKGFCNECMPLPEIKIKDIAVKVCSQCRRYLYKNKWTAGRSIDAIISAVAKESTKKKISEIKSFLPENMKYNPGIIQDFEIELTKEGDVFRVPAKILVTLCENCSRKQGSYMEGVLQLRNPDEEIMNFVNSFSKNNNLHISNTTKSGDGYDFDISDQKKVQNLGHQLQKQFGGILKISPRIFTKNKQTSKDVYRVNVYFEAPEYKKGDIIKIGKQLLLITSSRKILTGQDIKTGKKVSFDMKNKEYTFLKSFETHVSRVFPSIEIIDPVTYQSVPVQNEKHLKLDDAIMAVNDDGLFYLI